MVLLCIAAANLLEVGGAWPDVGLVNGSSSCAKRSKPDAGCRSGGAATAPTAPTLGSAEPVGVVCNPPLGRCIGAGCRDGGADIVLAWWQIQHTSLTHAQ